MASCGVEGHPRVHEHGGKDDVGRPSAPDKSTHRTSEADSDPGQQGLTTEPRHAPWRPLSRPWCQMFPRCLAWRARRWASNETSYGAQDTTHATLRVDLPLRSAEVPLQPGQVIGAGLEETATFQRHEALRGVVRTQRLRRRRHPLHRARDATVTTCGQPSLDATTSRGSWRLRD